LWAKILGQKEMRARQLSNRGGYIDLLYDEEANSVAIAGQAKTVLKGEIYV
jgi:predicted PhzF superfamily epimerase YddE/YHI9